MPNQQNQQNKPKYISKTRQIIIDEFKQCLSQDQLPWEKEWLTFEHHNLSTGNYYKGVNAYLLTWICNYYGYDDPRWMTFNQIAKDEKLHLTKGSKGVPVEYWSAYDTLNKKKLTIDEANVLLNDEKRRNDVKFVYQNYTVFNGSCIEGLEPWIEKDNENYYDHDKHPETALAMSVFKDYLINEGITIEYKGDRSYYNSVKDKIVMPDISMFDSPESFLSVQGHEISHSTGHESRLHRDIQNLFGSMEYAQEELIAEISSAFLMPKLGIDYKKNLDNNKAYIQSWTQMMEDKPNELIKAIKMADKVNDFILDKGSYLENVKRLNSTKSLIMSEYENMVFEEKLDFMFFIENEVNHHLDYVLLPNTKIEFKDNLYQNMQSLLESQEFTNYLTNIIEENDIDFTKVALKPYENQFDDIQTDAAL
ncbi:MAG: ssDNA-binding domain-containing protein [Erysipelotrichaceae bacterium]|nr:ssDNA-binding domain-containing protein [Erysipelotrichaceae bacterium]